MDRFGVYSVDGLRDAGLSAREIERSVNGGQLTRVVRGWYATALADADVVRAIRLGGRVGCLSGCRLHGLWTPEDRALHVMLNPGSAQGLGADGVEFHRANRACKTPIAPLIDCLEQVIQRHDGETSLIALESALNLGLVPAHDIQSLISGAPVRKQRGLHHFRPGAQSGSETRVRLFFQQRNVPVQTQVLIPGVGRVDTLVGRSWIVEADSYAFHASRAQQEIDGQRDVNAWEGGYDRTRLTFGQIWHTWESTQRHLIQRLQTRRHLAPPRPRAA